MKIQLFLKYKVANHLILVSKVAYKFIDSILESKCSFLVLSISEPMDYLSSR